MSKRKSRKSQIDEYAKERQKIIMPQSNMGRARWLVT
jgi:hypothetical protein